MAAPPEINDVRAISYFESLSDDEAQRIAREWSARSYQARELIFREGDPARGFYLMRKGKARILRTGPDGREQTFRIASSGDTFGEVPVIDRSPSPATVQTMEASEVVFIPTDSFIRAIRSHPDVALRVLVHIARRLRSFTELVEQISLQTVQARLARYVYQLAREEGATVDGSIVVPREITQQDLASIVGSVREVVSRTLKAMEEDGILTVRRHEFVVHDLGALRAML